MLDISRLKKLIAEKGFTQKSFAAKIPLGESSLYDILNTGSTRSKTIQRMAELLEVPMDYLYEGSQLSKVPLPNDVVTLSAKEILKMWEDEKKRSARLEILVGKLTDQNDKLVDQNGKLTNQNDFYMKAMKVKLKVA